MAARSAWTYLPPSLQLEQKVNISFSQQFQQKSQDSVPWVLNGTTWRYGLSVKWPPSVHLFEHLVPSWATLSREVVEPLGDGASLEEAGQWGGGRALGLQPDPSSCPVSASCSTEM